MSQPQSPQSPGMWSRFRRVAVRAFIYTFMAVLLGFIALKEAALWAVNRQLVGRATWEDLAIAPGVVTLRGVQVWDEAGAVVATVPELRVRFALDALWRSGVPVAALTEVVLEKPRLNATIRADGRFNLLSVLRPPKEPLPPGGALDRFRGAVLVRDGQVFLKDERGAGYFASFLKVDGLVDFTGPERGSGHLYFSQPGPPDARVRLDATWRRTLRDLRATLTVDDLDLAAWTNYYVGLAGRTLPAMARGKLLRGTAWAKLLVTADGPWDEWPRTATLTGAAAFARVDGALERFAVPIRNARGQLVLTQDLLEVSGLSGLLGPNAVRASGRFFNRKDPQIDVALRLSTDDLARSLAEFGMQPRGRLGGRGELAVRFVGALARPLMDGTVKAPLLQVGGQTLRDVTGNFANVHGLWRLDGVEGRAADGVVRASGWVLGDAQNRLVLDVRTTDLALGRLLNGVEARVTADLAVLGAPADLLVTGAGDFRGLRVGALHFSDTRGAFVYGDRALFLSGVEAATQFGRLRAPFGFVDFASKRILMDLRGHG
ncbi:MAG: hypothetical protein FJX76_13610, partial [Armatimonadetes bacterium]|nr:hypothetical protein [Armatimonadota bacterium]